MSHSHLPVPHGSRARSHRRTRPEPGGGRDHPLLALSGAVGNQAFQRALRRKPGSGKDGPCECGGACHECQEHEHGPEWDTELDVLSARAG